MSDEQHGDQQHEGAVDPIDATGTPAASGPVPRPVRRPRPAPSSSYVPGRRARAEETRGLSPILVPAFAAIALLALIGAIVFDHFHKTSAATPPPTPTVAPSPTPAPTATPMFLPPIPTSKAGAAAEANGQVVAMDVFNNIYRADTISIQQASQDPNTGISTPGQDLRTAAGRKALYTRLSGDLKNLIDSAIIDGYAAQHKLTATKAEIATTMNGYYSQAGGQAAFEQRLESQGYTLAVIDKLIADQATGQNVFNAVAKNAPCPCDLHARHILLKTKDKALADKLAKELQANHGANFAALAKKYSTDTASAKQGGDLGFFSKGQMVAPFDKAAFALKIGQISNPVKSQFGWHIIQVLGTRPSQASQQTYFTKWLGTQRAKATIHTYVQIPKS